MNVLLELLASLRNTLPLRISKKTLLPMAFIERQSVLLEERWLKLHHLFAQKGIDEILIEVSHIPVRNFNNKGRRLTWSDYTWLRRFFALLETIDWENLPCGSEQEAVVSQLIRMDFNHQRFFAYCYRLVKSKLDAHTSKKAKLNEILHCKTLVLQDSHLADHRFEPKSEKISVQLCNWIDAELPMIAALEPDDKFGNPFKLLHTMNIFCVGLWYKMLYDLKFYDEPNLEVLAEKLVNNISTKRAVDLSAHSLSVKFHLKDERIIRKLRKFVQQMLEYLDKLLVEMVA
ncbi:hypothetical protein FO440_22330 [Mucilaginibacter corticis]|uniref:Uncharacterized protein n=1 Tax=Mucilaginibacter corticis TaxID=2597670 RepID=A0A556M9L0_9SPHI|nr:hypothetical protein [Mucilaginibacter corticis]TSJ36568.1 hypothetical protein FO440_22330 [Mucilaginibacter corticis]